MSPCRRATPQAVAPSARLSATIRALTSAGQVRRRPAPVKISSRCTVPGSGTCLRSVIDM